MHSWQNKPEAPTANDDNHTLSVPDDRYVVWFDIDNTLYSASTRIAHAMGKRIHAYFLTLGLDESEASELHLKYYTQYGLALRGLTGHHDVGEAADSNLSRRVRSLTDETDPLDFDRQCDGALPLEDMLQPSPLIRKLLQDIDRSKARVWALTNAYSPHARRVLRILNLEDQIEDIVYCDYQDPNFLCKPQPGFYHLALKQANVSDPSKCFFVDDSRKNIDAARSLGWGACVHFCEAGLQVVEGGKLKEIGDERVQGAADNDIPVISDLEELRVVWPQIF